jgi:hypothetical protein
MARWIGIALLAALLAGCGIDQGKLESAADAARTTTTTTAPTGTTAPHTTEPSQRASAEDLLLDQGDLGSDWIEGGGQGGGNVGVPLPDCARATSGTDPVDEAHAAFIGGAMSAVLLQRVAVYGSQADAHQALARFRSGLDACESSLIHVGELSLPGAGDEVEAAKLQLGGTGLGAPFELACVRVGARVSCLTYVAPAQSGPDQFPTIVRAAAAKLG